MHSAHPRNGGMWSSSGEAARGKVSAISAMCLDRLRDVSTSLSGDVDAFKQQRALTLS
jgi:hypothetical protein